MTAKSVRLPSIVVLVSVCWLLFAASASWAEVTYHVSVQGNDRAAGTAEEPFRSLGRAQRAVRTRLKQKTDEPVTVLVHEGTYWLDQPLTFTPADSGTAEAPVTYRAADAGEVILSGGMPIDGWEKDGDLWRVQLDETRQKELVFHQLFVNDRRAQVASTPNEFYLRTAGPIEPLGDRLEARRDPSKKQGFRFREGDFKQWDNLDDVRIELYHSWTTSLHWIKDLDLRRRIVRFTNHCAWPVGYWEQFERYRIYNYFEALDFPGEWYLNQTTGALYYWPRSDEDMRKAEVIAPRLTDLVRIEGKPEAGEFVEHLRLVGLSFRHEDWDFDRNATVDGQAHAKQQNAAFTAFGLKNAVIEGCEFAHVGGHAIRLDKGCQGNRISACHIRDCGGGGIYVGPDAEVCYAPPNDHVKVERNVIENNFIHDTSRVLGGSIGIWIGSSSFNQVRHNEISDFDYTGISVGWCWGRQTDIFQRENLIEYNHIHHNVGDILSDNGGIYVLGYSPGSVIRGNVIHHIRHYPYINDSRGIYLDGNTSEYLVEKNLVHHIDSFGVTLKGQHNVVRNNIFAFCGDSGFNRLFKAHAQDFEYDQSSLKQNIVYQSEGAMTSGYHAPRWTEIDHNMYWSEQGTDAIRFNDRSSRILQDTPKIEEVSFARWQELGRDQHSLTVDPRFVEPAAEDFRLAEDSPAKAIEFERFDYARAGLHGPSEWTALPKQIQRQPLQYAPPPPSGIPFDYGFERYEPGAVPIVTGRLMEGENCHIRVTDKVSATGDRALAFTDGPADQTWLPHWALRLQERKRATVDMSCEFLNDAEAPARFRIEFRDWSGSQWHGGPTVTVAPDGAVRANGKELMKTSPGTWTHLEISFTYGSDAANTFTLKLQAEGQETKVISDLPFSSERFSTCTWFGISSLDNEKAAYYLDNVRLTID
ncbi:MAG: right-handed parallel beta-helix repeat-containing protein [Pirellulaceae bacterium]